MKKYKLCLVVPCYNEEARLRVNVFKDYSDLHEEIFILFVNDGSTDKTIEILKDLKSENMDYLDLEQNVGKAEAVRQGLLYSLEKNFDFIGFWDADLATPLEEISGFLDVSENKDLVMGSRVLRLGGHIQRKWYRHLLGRVFATVASKLLDIPVYDTQCGAKIFSKKVAASIFKDPFISYWIFDVELLFRMKKMLGSQLIQNVVEVPLKNWRDEKGSKLSFFDFLKAPLEMLKIYKRYR